MPKYTVTVTETSTAADGVTQTTQKIFEQSVEAIDLKRLFVAVNMKPRKSRASKTATAS